MSHLISTYAGATGLKIDSRGPSVLSNFIALPFSRYITVQTGSGQGAKNYDYWQEVIGMVGPLLSAKQISIVHLGAKDDPPLQGVHDMRGKTSIAQSHYLIQNTLCHMGNDSWLAHCAGWNKRPLVAVYGSTSVQNHGPYWMDHYKTILISSHRAGGVPTYASQENPKTINWITPEEVANAVMSLVYGGTSTFVQQTRVIGMLYTHALFDVVPNSFPGPSFLPEAPFTVRMDILHDENVLKNLLMTGRKVNILTKKPIDVGLLKQFAPSILSYTHEIDDQCPPFYAGMMGGIVRHTSFFTKEPDADKVAALRFRYFDICSIQKANDLTKEDYLGAVQTYTNRKSDDDRKALTVEVNSGKLRFKSNHYLLSDGKMYLSRAHLNAGKASESLAANHDTVIDDPSWFADLNHFLVYYQP